MAIQFDPFQLQQLQNQQSSSNVFMQLLGQLAMQKISQNFQQKQLEQEQMQHQMAVEAQMALGGMQKVPSGTEGATQVGPSSYKPEVPTRVELNVGGRPVTFLQYGRQLIQAKPETPFADLPTMEKFGSVLVQQNLAKGMPLDQAINEAKKAQSAYGSEADMVAKQDYQALFEKNLRAQQGQGPPLSNDEQIRMASLKERITLPTVAGAEARGKAFQENRRYQVWDTQVGASGWINGKALNIADVEDPNRYRLMSEPEVAAVSGSLRSLETRKSQVMSFADTAEKNMDLAEDLSNQTDRTGSPVVNKWLLRTQKDVMGDPMVAKYDMAIRSAVNEYAKVINSATGGGVSTDSARGEIWEMLNPAMTKQQVSDVLTYMKKEMQNRREGFDIEKKNLIEQLKPPGTQASSGDTPPVNLLKEGVNTTFGNGQVWTLKNGIPKKVR